jgi:BTB/POZ domain-containing protein 9
MKESKLEEIELRDTQLQPFRHLLRYIYTGQMSLTSQKDELILEILGLAHQYGFIDLETSISDYLRLTLLDIRNVSLIYDTASLYQLENLVNACCSFMDKNASEVIKHESLAGKFIILIIMDDSCIGQLGIFLVRILKSIHKSKSYINLIVVL